MNDLSLKSIVTFLLPRWVTECVPLLLATALFQLNIVRYFLFSTQASLAPDHQESLDFVISYLPWNVPESPRSWLGLLALWVCGYVWFTSEIVLDLALTFTGRDPHQGNARRRGQKKVSFETMSIKDKFTNNECYTCKRYRHSMTYHNINVTDLYQNENDSHEDGSTSEDEFGLEALRSAPAEPDLKSDHAKKAVRSLSSLASDNHNKNNNNRLSLACEHHEKKLHENPAESRWTLAPSLLQEDDADAEIAAVLKTLPHETFPSPSSPSYAEVVDTMGRAPTRRDQNRNLTQQGGQHDSRQKSNHGYHHGDMTYAEAASTAESAESGPWLQDQRRSLSAHEQTDLPTVPQVGLDDTKTFAQAVIASDIDRTNKSRQKSADDPEVRTEPMTFAAAVAATPDRENDAEKEMEMNIAACSQGDHNNDLKTYSGVVRATVPLAERHQVSDAESMEENEGHDEHHPAGGLSWSPASNWVEPPSPSHSAKGHESEHDRDHDNNTDNDGGEDHGSVHSVESSTEGKKNRGTRVTNRRNKNKSRKQKEKIEKLKKLQSASESNSTDTAASAPERDVPVVTPTSPSPSSSSLPPSKKNKKKTPSLPLTATEQQRGKIGGTDSNPSPPSLSSASAAMVSTATLTATGRHDLSNVNKAIVTTTEDGVMVDTNLDNPAFRNSPDVDNNKKKMKSKANQTTTLSAKTAYNTPYIDQPNKTMHDQNHAYPTEIREYLFKVLVLGDSGVGKTSIIKRYVHNIFSMNYKSTIGVDFALKVVQWAPDTVVRMQLWDIAGQERFGNMTRVYYKEAVAALVVYDVTRPKTFEAVAKWKSDLDSKVSLPPELGGGPIPTILLANKMDLHEDHSPGLNAAEMEKFCEEHGFLKWFGTSAKDNNNIEDAVTFLLEDILLTEEEFASKRHPDDAVMLDRVHLSQSKAKEGCC
ncbi:rab32, member RAS oncoprotein [Gryganskiella cystojenkinii]|nr:rab32, member RAS oncoprotein [Gryganskiella cystojenkinii]